MWRWIGELLRWFNIRGRRLDFESVADRWQVLFDETNQRQDRLLATIAAIEAERDSVRDLLRKCHEEGEALRRKLLSIEDELGKAVAELVEHKQAIASLQAKIGDNQ